MVNPTNSKPEIKYNSCDIVNIQERIQVADAMIEAQPPVSEYVTLTYTRKTYSDYLSFLDYKISDKFYDKSIYYLSIYNKFKADGVVTSTIELNKLKHQ